MYYYFNGPSTPLSLRIAVNRGGTRSYLASDHPSTALRTGLGSTSVWTDSNGNEGGNQRYYAYGANRAGSGDTPTDYQFTGQRRDFNSNLYQMGARWYDPYLNRWVQPDTIIPDWYDPQSLNRYAYVNNNPVNHTDPTGHCEIDECPSTYQTWTDNLNDWIDSGFTDEGEDDGKQSKPANVIYLFDTTGHGETLAVLVPNGFLDNPFWELSIQIPEGYAIVYPLEPSAPMCPALVGSAGKPAVGDPLCRLFGGKSLVNGPSWTPENPKLLPDPGNLLGLPGTNTGEMFASATLLDPTGVTVRPAIPIPPNKGGRIEWLFRAGTVETQIKLNRVEVTLPGKTIVYTRPESMGPRAFWDLMIKLFPKW